MCSTDMGSNSRQALVAIPDPAPSIPARFRLYHGGTARRGYLATDSPGSGAYLGDFVYFSSLKSYAREYAHHRTKHAGRGRLFVIDSRYLPDGSRIMQSDDNSWPSRAIGDLLCALIDMSVDLAGAARLLDRHAIRSFLAPCDVEDLQYEVWRQLTLVRFLRRHSGRSDSPAIVSDTLVLAEPAPSDDFPAKDRWNSLALFLLETFGTLDVTAAQLRTAARLYRTQWLSSFTVPLHAANLDLKRQEAATASARHGYPVGGNGLIALVPGKIPVLDERDRDRPRTDGVRSGEDP
jgi:hypothetical protein